MLIFEKKEITKEIYNYIVENCNGIVTDDVLKENFNQCMLYGYGVYSPKAIQERDKFYIGYKTSTSCD